MNSCELALFVTSVACALTNCLTEDELSLLSVMLTQLADTLNTIAVHNEICDADKSEKE